MAADEEQPRDRRLSGVLETFGYLSLALIELAFAPLVLPVLGVLQGRQAFTRWGASLWGNLSAPLIQYGWLHTPRLVELRTVLVATGTGYVVRPAESYPIPPAPLERWAIRLTMLAHVPVFLSYCPGLLLMPRFCWAVLFDRDRTGRHGQLNGRPNQHRSE